MGNAHEHSDSAGVVDGVDFEAALNGLHMQIESLRERTAARDTWRIQPGSRLALDDAVSAPFQTSHTVDALIGGAVDHAHALTSLVTSTRTLHRAALFTLARAAIESASTALWVLDPPDRSVRVQRTLRVHATDVADALRAAEDLAVQPTVTFAERISQLHRIAAAADAPFPTTRIPGVQATEVVRHAHGRIDAPATTGLLPAWRLFSGMAHSRPWADVAFADRTRTRVHDQLDQVITQTSLDRVVYAASLATDAIQVAIGRRRRLAHEHDRRA